ncbi:MAG: hypothetical protein M5U34_31175 [Chloroflexi bacterium]|nr:hypothetical protein [Chloroflexota bacterium]
MERMQRFLPLAKEMAEDDDALTIIAMLLDDIYQQSLYTPPPQPTEEKEPPVPTETAAAQTSPSLIEPIWKSIILFTTIDLTKRRPL